MCSVCLAHGYTDSLGSICNDDGPRKAGELSENHTYNLQNSIDNSGEEIGCVNLEQDARISNAIFLILK